ncbi:RIP metalloprotease RseP [Flavobacterium sp. MAH-1]|uniref:Zinc metalloprotease n=1 Tax=Flavobacterium agri TaxID=2743471 RepID=A0A7Y9C4K8_9FLAO|nr:RIP metalloprotease RseP [Flavobacterium agri]NUY80281.1 RIP metalloprotease RseP [Flavobacterium agri]NYA70306.1 RIP metalloprotease RseP [Flavobacterium agri]
MDIVVKLSQFLLSLSLLIILHELGHFIPAKLFKTRVEKFYLFFDVKFSLFKKKIGETVYGIGWLPLGGYVKISGMIDESMDTEQMAQEAQPWEFRSKPAWQRLIIMLGGVTVNFVLAFLIYIGIAYAYGDSYVANTEVKDGIWVTNEIGEKVGFKNGDKIVNVDGKEFTAFEDAAYATVFGHKVTVERNGQLKEIDLPVDLTGRMMDGEKVPLFTYRIPFVVGNFADDSPNKDILQKGDVLKSINGETLRYFDQVKAFGQQHKSQTLNAVVLRDNKDVQTKVTFNKDGKLLINPAIPTLRNLERLDYYKLSVHEYSFSESFPAGVNNFKESMGKYLTQLKAIFTPSTGAYKGVGGFYAIFNIFPDEWAWQNFWNITAVLSIMLGVMNLLPIPALDGGHVMFLLYEMITRRKPSDKFMEYAQMTGFVLLIGLILFANGNDIYKAILGR